MWHLLKSGFHVSNSGEPRPQGDPDSPTHLYPSPLHRPYHAHLRSLSLTWTRSGSWKESNFRTGRKATSASSNHVRHVASFPARPRPARNWRRFGRGLAGNPGTWRLKPACGRGFASPTQPFSVPNPGVGPPGSWFPSGPAWGSSLRCVCLIQEEMLQFPCSTAFCEPASSQVEALGTPAKWPALCYAPAIRQWKKQVSS